MATPLRHAAKNHLVHLGPIFGRGLDCLWCGNHLIASREHELVKKDFERIFPGFLESQEESSLGICEDQYRVDPQRGPTKGLHGGRLAMPQTLKKSATTPVGFTLA